MAQVDKQSVEGANPKSIEVKDPNVVVANCFPGVNPSHLEIVGMGSDAVVLISFATGSTPRIIAPAIKKLVDSGCPVFLLSDNRGDDHGILNDSKYEAQIPARDAGAISLQSVNIKHLNEVLAFINGQVRKGAKGEVLAQIVKTHYALKPGDDWYEYAKKEPPVSQN